MSGANQQAGNAERALLETTVILDRRKMPARAATIEGLLKQFGFKFTTSIALLEFKATLLQECIFLYNLFRESTSFSRVRDQVTESKHRQQALRLHVIHNMLQVCEEAPRTLTN